MAQCGDDDTVVTSFHSLSINVHIALKGQWGLCLRLNWLIGDCLVISAFKTP